MKRIRIDTHQHFLPPGYEEWLRSGGFDPGRELPSWSEDAALAAMERFGIRHAIVSLSRPGTSLGDDRQARQMARSVNEFAATLVVRNPDRFGFFASLPLPDVDGALAELAYSLDTLNADGVILLANTLGQYLGDRALEPLMEELDRRGTVVFVHPNALPGPSLPGLPPFIADFLLDTTRAALNLVASGTIARHRQISFILSHAGGFLPFVAHRAALRLASLSTTGRTADDLMSELRSFYFDTALSASPTSLPSLLAFTDPSHVSFGSDWPYPPTSMIDHFTRQLDEFPGLTDADRASIYGGTAAHLFPRLSALD